MVKANKSKVSTRYSPLGLRRNPFSGQILPSDQPPIAPYKSIKKAIDNFIDAFLENRASRGMVFIGDYGTGKTYHLKWMKNEFDRRQDGTVRTVYLETPGFEPYDLVRGILNEIGEEQIAKGVWNIVQPIIIQEIKSEGQSSFLNQFAYEIQVKPKGQGLRTHQPTQSSFSTNYFGTIGEEDLLDHRRFLQAFDKTGHLSREKLRDYIQAKLRGTSKTSLTKNIGVARELATLCAYSGAPALSSWEKLVSDNDTKAFPSQGEPELLQAIVRILVKSGVEYLVLFLDELEKIPLLQTLTEREARRYLDTFRMLIDRNWHELPFAWVLGANDDAWDLIEKNNRAFTQRMLVKLSLPRTDDRDIAEYIISEFLKQARTDDASVPQDNTLFPFPDNLLEIVPLKYRRTPRDLVKLCDLILEESIRERNPRLPICAQVVERVVQENFGIEKD